MRWSVTVAQGAPRISLAEFNIPDSIRARVVDNGDAKGEGAISRRYSESAVDLHGRISELWVNVPQELRLCRCRVDKHRSQDE